MERLKGLYIKGTSKTPEIDFSPGMIQISGRSIPEDSISFFQPIMKWIEAYVANPEKFTKVNLKIEYINSGSNRFVYNILKMIDEGHRAGHNFSISWYYEEDDDTIKNLGEDFAALLKVPFNLVIIT
jgi:hypothetical protein